MKLVIRADGNAKIGLGHIFRGLAFAELSKNKLDVWFTTKNAAPAIKTAIRATCHRLIEIPVHLKDGIKEADWMNEHILEQGDVFILDGYHFTTDYQRTIKKSGVKLICFDDLAACHYVADVVINHAGGWKVEDFSAEAYTQFCLGPEYALLRQPFLAAAKQKRNKEEKSTILLCFGGADPNNDTLRALGRLIMQGIEDKIILITGAAYAHQAALQTFIRYYHPNIERFSNLGAEEMVAVMQRSTAAILPPSTIAYEYLSTGGDLYLYQIADNQKYIKSYLLQEGLAFEFKEFSERNKKKTAAARARQQTVFDGKSGERLLNLITNTEGGLRYAA